MAEETTYLKGVLQDHTGNKLLPKTQASQVETEDGSTVETKLATAEKHLSDHTNPHKVTAAQVGARPNTWVPTAEEVGATPAKHASNYDNPHHVTADQVGAAPSSHLESKGHMFPVTASLSPSGTLELTGDLPADKDGLTVQFVSPAASTEGLQAKFAGSDTLYPILTTGEGKEPIQAGAWDQGVPVTLTVSGGSCFFKVGAGDYGTLPPQTRITAKAGNAEIALTLQTAADSPYFAGTLLVRKEGSAPERISDGVKIDVGKAAAYTDTGLTNDVEYHYRAFAYNPKRQYQTELTGAVAAAIPRATPSGYTELVRITNSTTWTVPKDDFYQVFVFGPGGNGGRGGNRTTYGRHPGGGGGGGGAGGVAILQVHLKGGEQIPITINAAIASFGSYCTATGGSHGAAGGNGSEYSKESDRNTPGGPGGKGGTASGGNVQNLAGGAGGSGGQGGIYDEPRNGTGGVRPINTVLNNFGFCGRKGTITYKTEAGGGGGGGGAYAITKYTPAAVGGDGGRGSDDSDYPEGSTGSSGSSGSILHGGGGGGGGLTWIDTDEKATKSGGIGAPGVVIIEKGVYN